MPDDDNVIVLADRVLGECPLCAQPVLFADNFIRSGPAFVHVRCTLAPGPSSRASGGDFPRPAPPPDRGA